MTLTDSFAGDWDGCDYHSLDPFLRVFEQGLPILCYHKIRAAPPGAKWRGTFLPPRFLRRQLGELAQAGFQPAMPADFRATGIGRRVVLTFDDGSATVARVAMPMLEKYGFRGMLYVVSGHIGGWNEWDTLEGEVRDRLMNDGEIRAWLRAGHRIGAHTRTHPRLDRLPPAELEREVRGGKQELEDRFGVEVTDFCYPYGVFNDSVVKCVGEAGYSTAVTLRQGVNTPGENPLSLLRIGVRRPTRNFRRVFQSMLRWFGRE